MHKPETARNICQHKHGIINVVVIPEEKYKRLVSGYYWRVESEVERIGARASSF